MTNPGDIVRIRSRTGGRASVYEANMWAQKWPQGLFSGNGVVQNTVPDMNVLVGGSTTNPDVVIGENPAGYKIALDIVGQQAVQVTAPATNSRIVSIVAYTDDLALASVEDTTTGSPATCGLIVVNGTTSSSPVPPSDSTIRSAITSDGATGSQAIYAVIANITVASNTTAITNTLIDIRRSSTLDWRNEVAFAASRSSALNVGSSQITIAFNNELYDLSGSYNPSTGVFTAPVDGIYSFTVTILAEDSATNRFYIAATVTGTSTIPTATLSDATITRARTVNAHIEGKMEAGSTLSIGCYSASTTNVAHEKTQFAGHLVTRL